jgi:hypothetical protein
MSGIISINLLQQDQLIMQQLCDAFPEFSSNPSSNYGTKEPELVNASHNYGIVSQKYRIRQKYTIIFQLTCHNSGLKLQSEG